MDKITVIIPIHEINEELITNAITSVPNDKNIQIMVVSSPSLIEKIKTLPFNEKMKINYVSNEGDTDYCSQINLGASKCKTKYFSILEMDDSYTSIWFTNVEKYLKHFDDVSLYLPLIRMVKYDDENIVSLANELAWSNAFVDENGFINGDCLNSYYDFMISGGIFDTNTFNEIGGLKKSLLIANTYEFLLRMANNSKKIFVIPKIGYNHTFGEPNSYTMKMSKEITQKHGEWLIKLAQQEKYFTEDRYKTFEE